VSLVSNRTSLIERDGFALPCGGVCVVGADMVPWPRQAERRLASEVPNELNSAVEA
jgi:hypothetical protein